MIPYIIIVILAIVIVFFYQSLKNANINYRQKMLSAEANTKIRVQNADADARQKIFTAYSTTLRFVLYQALSQMDNVCNFYTSEDEANRELTSCLNVLGHNSIYQFKLANGRTCDIFTDHSIIEGKLDLSTQTEIDRLIGQVNDYMMQPNYVYVILYGQVSESILNVLINSW